MTVIKCDICGEEIRYPRTDGLYGIEIKPRYDTTRYAPYLDVCRECVNKINEYIKSIKEVKSA